MVVEILIIMTLIVVNGLFAMSELAIVSSRPTRLRIHQNQVGAKAALELSGDPGRFLSSVQIGITLVGVLSGAFSGATLGMRFSSWLQTTGLSPATSEALGVGTVVLVITYLSLIIGELVPKQVALKNPERIAIIVAPSMQVISKIASPIITILDNSGKIFLRMLGQHEVSSSKMTEEEVKTMIAEAETAGILDKDEKEMIGGVMRLGNRTAKSIMTPRREVEMINLTDEIDEIIYRIRKTEHSRLPVQQDDADLIIGVIETKHVSRIHGDISKEKLVALIQPAPIIMDTASAIDVLKKIKSSNVHIALVFDEYSNFEGVITSADILTSITGYFSESERNEPNIVARADGSFLVSGWTPLDEVKDKIGLSIACVEDVETVAGFVISNFKRFPNIGEALEADGWIYEVVDVDGYRIDKLLLIPRKAK